ncbi:H-2 class I histocompatibility antigen, Q9 alpha chain-like [Myxocyprinus asiaticus]|uniref:H-2 class I histocompatibility antigen, Q9 alpha chain-like n=1 Tax=Myxocyprinus asiaticus TaxID=70543 RepID=UPI002223075C|nr:H-2 class I histocompatibility antigen, Q9 alpha chain-like [Myxocyprinus asiaticus]
MRAVILVLLCAHVANAATHSLQYFYTAVTKGLDFPEYTAVAMVDEKQFVYYDSSIYKMIPRSDWIKNNVGQDYWDRESKIQQGSQEVFKSNVNVAMQRFNQTKGKSEHITNVAFIPNIHQTTVYGLCVLID